MSDTVKVLVVTHGGAGKAMLAELGRLVTTDLGDFEALEFEHGEPRDAVSTRIEAACERLDHGAGVLVVCDLFGSTPANCAAQLPRGRKVAVLFGVNLPMLVKLASLDRTGADPAALAKQAAETAIRSIRLVPGEP